MIFPESARWALSDAAGSLQGSEERVHPIIIILLHDLKYKLGPKCGENIKKLADAPSFSTSQALGSLGRAWLEYSKPSKHYYGFIYDFRYIMFIVHTTGKENVVLKL